ncbi:MAG: hypothetical protein H0V79_02435 [Actinobacteria bacterium]|nr:hypothetical protein [Actinomycetota bacterium]
MADELAFVQLPHPGREHGPDEPGGAVKRWEHGEHDHKRKFMLVPGAWRERVEAESCVGDVLFWGEWEAASTVRPVGSRTEPGAPSWVHEPFFNDASDAPEGVVPQNTDPFVFGDRFLYTFCKQPGNGRLRRLARGSVVVFGSIKDKAFRIDTVLVVSESVDHTRETYDKDASPRASDVFRATTLDPMYAWHGTRGGRLYLGATPDEPVNGMFSFFPCVPASTRRAFARPRVALPDLINQTFAMQAKTTTFAEPHDLALKWRAVVDQVLAEGLALGVRAELPGGRGARDG